jgi:hypothetical protein
VAITPVEVRTGVFAFDGARADQQKELEDMKGCGQLEDWVAVTKVGPSYLY